MGESITDLVDIPAFEFVDNSKWSFPGAKVSKIVNDTEGCSSSGGEVLGSMQGRMLTLSDQAALLFLAIEILKGNSPDVPPDAVKGALQLFYNNLHMTITTSNPGHERQSFFGEWAYDALDFRNATESAKDGYVAVQWIKRPQVFKEGNGDYRYGIGEISEVVQTVIPRYQGAAVKTADGYLDPRTGAPFEVDSSQPYGCPEFSKELSRRIIAKAGDKNPAFKKLPDEARDGMINHPKRYHPLVNMIINDGIVKLNDVGLEDFIGLWRPSYGFSHTRIDEQLPLAEQMVVMRGIDEVADLFIVSLGKVNMKNCGIQVREAEYY